MTSWLRCEQRWRDALLDALIPAPGGDLPALGEIDLGGFWDDFGRVAPAHLRLGLRVAVTMTGAVLPWLLGYYGTLSRLDPHEREAVLDQGERLPLFADLLEIAKVVACLAYFADPRVQAAARGRA